MKKLIILSFTREGSKWNKHLQENIQSPQCSCEGFTISRLAAEMNLKVLDENLKSWIGEKWGTVDFLFIGAAGIAIRSIAPWVKDKYSDSAVLVMDEKGKYIIPLLSGHIGGAVDLAYTIAKYTNATVVTTTATDVQNKFAVDVFARHNRLRITDRIIAKNISAAILDGCKVGFYSNYPIEGVTPEELKLCTRIEELDEYPWGIVVSDDADKQHSNNVLNLVPVEKKNVIVGIGCRRGTEKERIQTALNKLLIPYEGSLEISCFTSIELKKDENGIKEIAEAYKVPFITYTAEELKKVDIVSEKSDFVKQVTGVDNVCERAARYCCPEGEVLQPKTVINSVTLALVQKMIKIKF
ncbi:MAG: cobalt-precorrin 5A hydrolase [Lachnospiraceae bacterium]